MCTIREVVDELFTSFFSNQFSISMRFIETPLTSQKWHGLEARKQVCIKTS